MNGQRPFRRLTLTELPAEPLNEPHPRGTPS